MPFIQERDRIVNYSIIGCGGHAKVVASIIRSAGNTVVAFYDDSPSKIGSIFCDAPVKGAIKDIASDDPSLFIIAIGSNKARKKIAESLSINWGAVIHPFSFIDPSTIIGHGSVICAGVVIQADSILSTHTIINTSASIDHDCYIGDFVHISPGVRLTGNVHISEGAQMGVNSCIIPEKRVGEWSVIGAGSTVIRDIPSYSVAVGSPAKVIKTVER